MDNWRRVATSRRWQSADHCRSLEARWRSPQHWHPPEPKPPEPDEKDAWRVETTWRLMPTSPHDYRAMVKYAIVWRLGYKHCCRLVGIHWKQFDHVLGRALAILRNRL